MISLLTGKLEGQEVLVRPILAAVIPWSLLYISRMLLESFEEHRESKEKDIQLDMGE